MDLQDRLRARAQELPPVMVALRHQLHHRPKAGLERPETQRAALEALDGLPAEISTGSSGRSPVPWRCPAVDPMG